MHKKSLLALSLALTFISQGFVVHAQNKPVLNSTLIRDIQQDNALSPLFKAIQLLILADSLLEGESDQTVYDHVTDRGAFSMEFSKPERLDGAVVALMQRVVRFVPKMNLDAPKSKTGVKQNAVSVERRALAKSALQASLAQLKKVVSRDNLLDYYFIAARLFHAANDDRDALECDSIVDSGIFRSEMVASLNEDFARMCFEVLDAEAYAIIPVIVNPPGKQDAVQSFPDKSFRECQKLKLHALEIVDRLSPENPVRQRAHRELALWYFKLGKQKLGQEQQEKLAKLIGRPGNKH